MSDAPADRYGVVGHPVAHSLSPEIHAAFAAQTGTAVDYRRVPAPLDGFVATVAAFFADGGRGLNVTLPFKLAAHAACGERTSDRARTAGAANWLVATPDGWRGDNTDGVGLVIDLARLLAAAGSALAGARVLLLGAGGAARGVLGPLLDAGPATLVIANRDAAKAAALARLHAVRGARAASITSITSASFESLPAGFDVVVNATSAGLGGDGLAIAPATLAGATLVYDLMYGAAAGPFLALAGRAGAANVADGLGMLVEQAAESFFLWRGVRPATAPVREALRSHLARPA